MASLKDEAQAYAPTQTKNIAELDKVSITSEMKNAEGIDNSGKPFNYKYIEVGSEKYRVPGLVIGMIKDLLEANPNLSLFKVKRTGEGIHTRYTVIPLS